MALKPEQVLYCESTLYTGDEDDEDDDGGPPHVLILAGQMKPDSDEEVIPGTQEVHFLYTPEQVKQFIADNEMDPDSQSDLEELIDDLKKTTWKDLPPLHLSGHHAQAVFSLAVIALSDDDPEDLVDDSETGQDEDEGSGLPN